MRARVVSCLALVCALGVAVPLAAQKAAGPTLVTGTVLGSDGKPMRLAHAHIRTLTDGAIIARVTAAPDGQFALAVGHPGAYYLEFTGVDHKELQVPLVTGRDAMVALDARLERNTYRKNIDSVAAIGDWNRFDRSSARPLVKRADGRYTLEVESSADEVTYQLIGLATGGAPTSGADAKRYVYNEDDGYRSVLVVHGGTATIVLDPRLLDRTPSAANVVFRDRCSFMARAHEIFASAQEWGEQYGAAIRAAREKNEAPQYDWKPAERDFLSRLSRERDPALRELILTRLLDFAFRGGARLDTAVAGRIAREVPPSSIWWAFPPGGGPGLILIALQQAAGPNVRPGARPVDSTLINRMVAYIDRAVAENPDRSVQAAALAGAVNSLMGQQEVERANQYYDRLKREYPESFLLRMMAPRFAPTRALRPGATIPDYRFAALGDSTVTFTRDSMKGKVYLIDFWGSWCTGCVKELPYLHQTYERFASKGFEILSVGVNEAPASIAKFRSGQWKMPWLHTAPTTWGSAELKPFEIVFVPRAVLVDRDGKIIAVDDAVSGERLAKAVEEALR